MKPLCAFIIASLAVALTSGMAASVSVLQVPLDSQGPPWYADFGRDFVPSNDTDAAIVFWRDPAAVPADFNLLELFDAPRAFGEPLLLTGTEYHDSSAEPGTPPRVSYYVNAQPLPVYFVSVSDLDAAMSDDVLTMSELDGMPSLRKGLATETRHYIRFLSNSTTVALGELEGGTPFFLRVSEAGDSVKTLITFERHKTVSVSDNGGVPAYLELLSGFIPEDEASSQVPLLFWRNPDKVSSQFNLLDYLDPPRAWGVEPLFGGHEFRQQGATESDPPSDYFYENDGPQPLYLVDRSELDGVIGDGQLTITELKGLPSLRKGVADHVTAYATLSPNLGGSSGYAAAGVLENGDAFFVDVFELQPAVTATVEIVSASPDPLNIDIAPAVAVSWGSQSKTIYQIQRSIDMETWETAMDTIQGTGERLTQCFVREETEVFYRVVEAP